MKASRRALGEPPSPPDPVGQGAIHTLPPLLLGGAVVFTSAQSRQGTELCLASVLLRALGRLDPRRGALPDEGDPTLRRGVLGRPVLFLGETQGPALSFSHGGERIWAAMSGGGGVGIDVVHVDRIRHWRTGHRTGRETRPLCQPDDLG